MEARIDDARAPDHAAIVAKFRANAAHVLPAHRVSELEAAVLDLETARVASMLALCRP
jgi:hypothetical protein